MLKCKNSPRLVIIEGRGIYNVYTHLQKILTLPEKYMLALRYSGYEGFSMELFLFKPCITVFSLHQSEMQMHLPRQLTLGKIFSFTPKRSR